MIRKEAIKELEKLVDKSLENRTPMNIRLYFNSDGELALSYTIEDTNYLTVICNSGDSPLEPYLETFLSSFVKMKRKRNEGHT